MTVRPSSEKTASRATRARAGRMLGDVIYVSLLGIPIVLLVIHLLTVLAKPSVDAQPGVVQEARRPG